MRLAVPIWGDRLSPVFDVARRLLLLEVESGRVVSRMEHDLTAADRARAASQLGVDLLVCGAVSLQLSRSLSAAGVEVIPNVCGSVEEVVHAFLDGVLLDGRFTMPGCSHGRPAQAREDRRGSIPETTSAAVAGPVAGDRRRGSASRPSRARSARGLRR